jgi:glycosyltransferase involved in cell wall biosynthesis
VDAAALKLHPLTPSPSPRKRGEGGLIMRIAYITAGAAGMFCGSCMHDNTLVSALVAAGHDALLIPTYTPIKTDEDDVSQERVFFGGINVFLQQKSSLFRRTPWFLDRLLDGRRLLNWVSRFAVRTEAQVLGDLQVSMLKGEHGYQRKEIAKLTRWLSADVKPEIIHLTAVLLSGIVPDLKRDLGVPVLASLQGDDIFLDSLPPRHRAQSLALIQENAQVIDGFVATSHSYADFMAGYLGLPRDKIHVVHPGLNLKGHLAETADAKPAGPRTATPLTIGYFARICPDKGFHLAVEAFRLLRQDGGPRCRLRASGWLGANQRAFFEEQRKKLDQAGLLDDFEHVESPDHESKVRFLQALDVLTVPTVYHEPKGLYILEALANGVPVVQPRHGSFPELIEATGGGILVQPADPAALARALRELLEQPQRRAELAVRGLEAIRRRFHAQVMAQNTLEVYEKYL